MKRAYQQPSMKVFCMQGVRLLEGSNHENGFSATISGYQSEDDESSGFSQE